MTSERGGGESDTAEAALATAELALRVLPARLPWLAELIPLVRLYAVDAVETAGVTPDARILVAPKWFSTLSPNATLFVMAHELLHLALKSFERRGTVDRVLFNIAHDYVINDILESEMPDVVAPAGGLRYPGARHIGVERILTDLAARGDYPVTMRAWDPGKSSVRAPTERDRTTALGAALVQAGIATRAATVSAQGFDVLNTTRAATLSARGCDILSVEEAEALAGGRLDNCPHRGSISATRIGDGLDPTDTVRRIAERAWDHRAAWDLSDAAWYDEARRWDRVTREARRSAYRAPFEWALHHGLEQLGPARRTYARASRRLGDRTDIVLPGRAREGWQLTILLDVTGSMYSFIPTVLGMIRRFGEEIGLDSVRLIQAGAPQETEDHLALHELGALKLVGDAYGLNTVLPEFERLAQDPTTDAVAIITDGRERAFYGLMPPPFAVLWIMPEGTADYLTVGFGQVVEVPI